MRSAHEANCAQIAQPLPRASAHPQRHESPVPPCFPQLGSTALHCAAGYGYDEVVKSLLAAGASKDLRDMVRQPPLLAGPPLPHSIPDAASHPPGTQQEGKTPADLARVYGAALPGSNHLGSTH